MFNQYCCFQYENHRFEEKFFRSIRQKNEDERIFYQNWVNSNLPETDALSNQKDLFSSIQDASFLINLIKTVDKGAKFKSLPKPKQGAFNKIQNTNSIIQCLEYLNKKFNNKFKTIHYTDFVNCDRKKILSFLFLIKYSYESLSQANANIECSIGKEQRVIIESVDGEYTMTSSYCDDFKESGFETETESLATDTFDTSGDILEPLNNGQILIENAAIKTCLFKNEQKFEILKKVKENSLSLSNITECNQLQLEKDFQKICNKCVGPDENSIENIDESYLKEDSLLRFAKNGEDNCCENKSNKLKKYALGAENTENILIDKGITDLLNFENYISNDLLQIMYQEQDLIRIEIDKLLPIFKIIENKLRIIRSKEKAEIYLHLNLIDLQNNSQVREINYPKFTNSNDHTHRSTDLDNIKPDLVKSREITIKKADEVQLVPRSKTKYETVKEFLSECSEKFSYIWFLGVKKYDII